MKTNSKKENCICILNGCLGKKSNDFALYKILVMHFDVTKWKIFC